MMAENLKLVNGQTKKTLTPLPVTIYTFCP